MLNEVNERLHTLINQTFSKIAAIPWPPPIQRLAKAYRLSLLFLKKLSIFVTSMAPVAPIGYPRATAPPR